MSNEKQYSWNELAGTSNDVETVLKINRDRKERQEEIKGDGDEKNANKESLKVGFERVLVFKLRSNQKKANEAMDLIEEENFPEKDPEYDTFSKERMELLQEYGADIQQHGNQTVITNYKDISSKDGFKEDDEDLKEKFKDVITAEEKRQNTIMEERKKKASAVRWVDINLDLFPEKLIGEEFPLSFVEFVVEE